MHQNRRQEQLLSAIILIKCTLFIFGLDLSTTGCWRSKVLVNDFGVIIGMAYSSMYFSCYFQRPIGGSLGSPSQYNIQHRGGLSQVYSKFNLRRSMYLYLISSADWASTGMVANNNVCD